MPWTDQETESLRGFLAGGMSCSQAAFAINREHGSTYTRNSVIGRATRMGMMANKVRKPALAKKPPPPTNNRINIARRVAPPIPCPPMPDPPLLCIEVEPRNVSLLDLAPEHCRWPFGEGADIVFCGHPVFHRSYCAAHFHLSIGPGTWQERSASRGAA